ncbi:phage tail tip lysozyme [Nocardia africana]|uniref:Phage tail tip lysozyme n=1 Tax=Nocardia africana TaxID=134964 RepID=A0ABW6NSR9_9NOCA
MSPDGTIRLGDLHKLPGYAPEGLIAFFDAAEAIIQEQVRTLGSGHPSEAPDLRDRLRGKGISNPEDKSEMVDKYGSHKKQLSDAVSNIERDDHGIVKQTAGIGKAVTDAYSGVDTAVRELNTKIDASWKVTPETWKDDDDKEHKRLPKAIVDGLFKAMWETLSTTYDKVHGVSDQAAAAALKIKGDAPPSSPGNPIPAVSPGSGPSAGVTPAGYNGSTPWSGQSGSTGTAIIPTEDKPTAMAMMKYLIDKYHFTPAQAAGIVANAKFESDFDVSATGDKGTAKGLFQWRFDRLSGLNDFASKTDPETGKRRNIGDWHTHIDYMVQELRSGGYSAANAAVNSNPNDARQVASDFDHLYEKSSGDSTDDRRKYAAGLLKSYNESNSPLAV